MNSIFLPLFAAHAWSVSVRQHKICAPIKITIKYKLLLEWLANTLLPHHHQSVHRYESFAAHCNGYNSTLNKIFTLKHTHNCIYILPNTHYHPHTPRRAHSAIIIAAESTYNGCDVHNSMDTLDRDYLNSAADRY